MTNFEEGTKGEYNKDGYDIPEDKYSKLPHSWFYYMRFMSLSELKVTLYVLRHTWGFSEFGIVKKITLDEFINGRKRKDGSRIDRGTGLSRPTVIDGLKKAVEHGHIEVAKNETDRGRIRHYYTLRIKKKETPQTGSKENEPLGLKNQTPYRERNLSNTMSELSSSDNVCENSNEEHTFPGRKPKRAKTGGRKKKQPSAFDIKAAKYLEKIVASCNRINGRSNTKEWANQFRLMREYDKVPKKDIVKILKWYKEFAGQPYMPEGFSGKSFREKYKEGKFASAMRRSQNGSNKPKEDSFYDRQTKRYVSKKLMRKLEHIYFGKFPPYSEPGATKPRQDRIDLVLDEELDMEPGSISARALNDFCE